MLVLAGVQDPGNVGAIVRAAEACGATGIVCTDGTADPFGWKALRGAMGSTFRVPIAVRQPLVARRGRARGRDGIAVAGDRARGGTPLADCRPARPTAVAARRRRRRAVARGDRRAADDALTIPMRAPVESLNVAIAAALDPVYEAARQREARLMSLFDDPDATGRRRTPIARRRWPSACGRARSTSSSARRR